MRKNFCDKCGEELFLILETNPVSGVCNVCKRYQTWKFEAPEKETAETENFKFRQYLWCNHGCEFGAMYGDDGEMQCGSCLLDFKRDPASLIIERIIRRAQDRNSGF